MKYAYSLTEIADALSVSRQGVFRRAQKDGWPSRPRSGRGGGREYFFYALPDDCKVAIRGMEVEK